MSGIISGVMENRSWFLEVSCVSGPAAGLTAILTAITDLGFDILTAVLSRLQLAFSFYFKLVFPTNLFAGIGIIIILKQTPCFYDDFEGDQSFTWK
jgi:hypothetical protein